MTRPYLILTTGRTGSSLLAHALARTGRHGTPDEHLTVPEIDEWSARLGVPSPLHGGSMLTYLDALRAHTSSPGGGFGTKLNASAVPMVARCLAAEPSAPGEDPARLLAWAFPDSVVLWSRRRDRVAGATSMWRARATGTWARPAGTAAAEPDVEPSVGEITELHRLLHAADLQIAGLVARSGLPLREVVYEDLIADWDATLVAVRRFLGEEGAIPPAAPPALARQAGPRAAALIDRWAAATGGCAACGHPSAPVAGPAGSAAAPVNRNRS